MSVPVWVRHHDYIGAVLFGLLALGTGSYCIWFSVSLVHVAHDGGHGLRFDDLLGRRLILPWGNIEAIDLRRWTRSRTYAVRFRSATAFGRRVFFIPAWSCRPRHVEELRDRIAEHAPASLA